MVRCQTPDNATDGRSLRRHVDSRRAYSSGICGPSTVMSDPTVEHRTRRNCAQSSSELCRHAGLAAPLIPRGDGRPYMNASPPQEQTSAHAADRANAQEAAASDVSVEAACESLHKAFPRRRLASRRRRMRILICREEEHPGDIRCAGTSGAGIRNAPSGAAPGRSRARQRDRWHVQPGGHAALMLARAARPGLSAGLPAAGRPGSRCSCR